MEKTPVSMRKHIALLGKTNAGKSTLFNALVGQDISIISDIRGTTTDPITKAAELTSYGAVAFIDTAGLDDTTELGALRVSKTQKIIDRTDLILHIIDIQNQFEELPFKNIPTITVFTKCDLADTKLLNSIKEKFPDSVFIGSFSDDELDTLRKRIVLELEKQTRDDETLLGNLIPEGSTVIMVIPIDSAAPKGRLILPQVQAIRDCLDHNITAVTVTPEFLPHILSELPRIDLVVTDSQIFKSVSEIVPVEVPLTSFSMLLANQKGRIELLIKGTAAIPHLCDGDEILILESCTHTTTHDDIGKVKIPHLLRKKTGKNLIFTHASGYSLPDNLKRFKLIIQCGGCMINKREIISRLARFEEMEIPVTNYGVVLAYLSGILDRASSIFKSNS